MLMVIIMLSSFAMVPGLDCQGIVLDTDRQPVENAAVRIYTAKVRIGTSPYCPSCYADCGKWARTDEKGRFIVHSLDPELLFDILVVAEGYGPKSIDNVDPAQGSVDVVLSRMAVEQLVPSHVVRGRVVGPDGRPVAGAMIEPVGKVVTGETMVLRPRDPNKFDFLQAVLQQGQSPVVAEAPDRILPCDSDEVDPLAVTNEQGAFLFTTRNPDLIVCVRVRAPGLAACCCRSLRAGSQIQEIRLGQGCVVKGRLVRDGTFVEGATVGVVQTDRRVGNFLGEYTTGLRKDGHFEVDNLPSNTDYYIYGKMESLQGRGAVPVREFRTGDEGTAVDVGELTLERGHELTGRVVLGDGRSIPHKTRLVISRQDAWDSLICELDKEGRFHAGNLPTGGYSIVVDVRGYRMSSGNCDFIASDRFSLKGTINGDVNELMVRLEPESLR